MARPMHVTHVVENLERGGLERMVIDLALHQHAQGIATRVVALYQPGELAGELRARGVPVLACGKRHGTRLRPLAAMARALAQWPAPAVIHSHNAMAHAYATAASAMLGGRGLINTRHGMGKERDARIERLYRMTMPRTGHVVAVCEQARQQLQAWGVAPRGGLSCIHNGIRLQRIARDRLRARQALAALVPLADGATVIGTVGRLEQVKRHDLLIDAFARLRLLRPHEDLHLVLIGEGRLRQALEEAIAAAGGDGRIHLLGARDDVGGLLAGMDLFAMSSDSEGYSLALVEAAAAGLPIVATDVGGNREILGGAGCGLLVAPGNAEPFAQAMAAMLADPARLRGFASAGVAWAEREASIEAMAARYLELYLHLPGMRRNASAAAAAGARP